MASNIEASRISGRRAWLNRHAGLVGALIVALFLGLGLALVRTPEAPPGGALPGRATVFSRDVAWYYVPETGEYFVGDGSLYPPIQYKGKQAVKAYFYGCGDCSTRNRFLGYYEAFTPEGKAQIQRALENPPNDFEENTIICYAMQGRLLSKDAVNWMPEESEAAGALQDAMRERCEGRKLVFCHPGG